MAAILCAGQTTFQTSRLNGNTLLFMGMPVYSWECSSIQSLWWNSFCIHSSSARTSGVKIVNKIIYFNSINFNSMARERSDTTTHSGFVQEPFKTISYHQNTQKAFQLTSLGQISGLQWLLFNECKYGSDLLSKLARPLWRNAVGYSLSGSERFCFHHSVLWATADPWLDLRI